ncbi:sphingomyelin phosphodiesterase [Galendromus occidentalis]|uniref:Sphingomyelin phosphodiesterase n=1 Tax=Galendromus occidentalis TaxID=34638 RepID=A0AAJ6QRS6_9ACAR|nr:sphingomyelin phosphodiesterase [Galendromus occidentalis]
MNIQSVIDSLTTGDTTDSVCRTCRHAAEAFRVALRWLSKRELIRYGRIGCNHVANIMSREVCRGLLKSYIDSIYDIGKLAFKAGVSERDACALIFGPDCGNVTAAVHIWEVKLPPVPALLPQSLSSANNFEIIHFSDFHHDPSYRQGALAQCTLPLCCRQVPSETNQSSTEPSKLAGRFGDLRHCDMPIETIESLVNDAFTVTQKSLSHIYLTGDIPPHDVWKSNQEEYFNISKTVYDLLKARFAVKMYPVVGNHEAVPPNLFSSKNHSSFPEKSTPQLYANLASFWSTWLGEEQRKTVLLGGYYAISVSPALKVIALNTNFCYSLNFWLLVDSRDPAGQLQWLVKELQVSELQGQKVHILGHISPGSSDCIFTWSTQFLKIVQRFSTTITGQFYGHTHYDEFRVFYAPDRSTPVGAAFIAPSATSYSSVNPAYKIFTYSGNGVLLDAVTRTFNLTNANEVGRIDWETEYQTRSAFNVKDLSPESMDVISKKLVADPATFQTYFRHYHRSSPSERWSSYSERRQVTMACSTRTDVHHDNSACLSRK